MAKYRIMVVDDSRVIYAEMKKMLEGSDIEIIGYCRSGEEALEMCIRDSSKPVKNESLAQYRVRLSNMIDL